MDIFKGRLTRNGLWLLFSVCAFPIHVWTLILIFRDFSWVSERTNSWDAVGVGSYGLIIAFVETVFVFICVVVLSFVIPKTFSEKSRITIMGVFILLTSIWAIIGQMYYLLEYRFPPELIQAIARNPHPLWILYGGVLAIVGPSVVIPIYNIIRSERSQNAIFNFIERLTILTSLYIFFDFCALVIVIFRNV